MNKLLYSICFIFVINISAFAQLGKEAWHWQFGLYCSLDFSSGVPVSGYDTINVLEGSASISDKNTGQLLFYTDGSTAWDKNGHELLNGTGMIGGYGTSTQGALIVPMPENSNLYYIITSDCGGYCLPQLNKGVHYSIVDMSLNSGLGAITIKNKPLTPPPTTEKLTAVKHCNDRDYWILTHPFNSDAFYVYLVTPVGIDTVPIISNVGTVHSNISGKYYETTGYLKASPNGKKLACAIEWMGILDLLDFDNSTGIVSNPISLTDNPKTFYPYGVSFSPDNLKLYTLATDSFLPVNTANLYQYDLSSGTASGISSSRVHIPFTASGSYFSAALQLGPDGKIYFPNNSNYSLSAITKPNVLGTSCNLNDGATGTGYHRVFFGLPNFIDANTIMPRRNTTKMSLCVFSTYSLSVNGSSNYQWSTGDTTANININNFGSYTVSYLDSNGCKEIDTFQINRISPPIIDILHDTLICNSGSFIPLNVNASDTNVLSYSWFDGNTNPVRTFTSIGNYWIDYSFSNFCVSKDSFGFKEFSFPDQIDLGNDTTFCLGKKVLNVYTPNCTYLWSTGETSSSIIATRAGEYWVAINNNGCKTYDSLLIYPEYSMFDFGMPNIVTPNNDGINDYLDFSKYQFSNMQLNIYNRWGKLVFESNDPAVIWKPLEDDGTYYYVLQYRIDCGQETQNKTLKGFITVIR